jgi:hypothetical protein
MDNMPSSLRSSPVSRGKKLSVDIVVTERWLVLLQAEAPQPSRNLHVALRSGVSLQHCLSLLQLGTECAMELRPPRSQRRRMLGSEP